MTITPPQALVGLSFTDIKAEIDGVLGGVTTAIKFIDKWGFFIPQKYKDSLDELLKLLTWLDTFLGKTPA